MAAKDYVFVESGLGNVYLAKRNKSQTVISDDRRVVEDNEIIGLFHNFLRRRCQETGKAQIVCTLNGETIFEATLSDKEDKK